MRDPHDDGSGGSVARPVPSAPVAERPSPQPARLTPELQRDSTWQGGYCDRVSVRNAGEQAVTWSVELVVLGTLSDHWSCSVSGSRGRVEFSGVEWNSTLLAGEGTEFGFCVSR